MKFWNFTISDEVVELRISGDIVDDSWAWIYEWFGEPCASPNLFREELEKCENKPLIVWIDSYGGDVFAAAGIYNALKEYQNKITVKIDGKAMSAATIIAMAGDEVMMSPTSIFMIHNPLTSAYGYASDLRKTADVLDTVKETIINAYKLKTNLPREDISRFMDEEKYMSAQDAVDEGFVDGILYVDTPAVLNFGFTRSQVSILNSADEKIRKMIELSSERDEPDQPDDEEDNINADLIRKNKFKNLLSYFEIAERI